MSEGGVTRKAEGVGTSRQDTKAEIRVRMTSRGVSIEGRND